MNLAQKVLEQMGVKANENNQSENYGSELDNLQKAFDKVASNMKGSSVADPLGIWIDLGVRNQFCDEDGKLLRPMNV